MLALSVVLAIIMVGSFSCALLMINSDGFWLLTDKKSFIQYKRSEIVEKYNLQSICYFLAILLFSICLYIIAIWCGVYFKSQETLLISTIIEIIFMIFSVIYINVAKKYSKFFDIYEEKKPNNQTEQALEDLKKSQNKSIINSNVAIGLDTITTKKQILEQNNTNQNTLSGQILSNQIEQIKSNLQETPTQQPEIKKSIDNKPVYQQEKPIAHEAETNKIIFAPLGSNNNAIEIDKNNADIKPVKTKKSITKHQNFSIESKNFVTYKPETTEKNDEFDISKFVPITITPTVAMQTIKKKSNKDSKANTIKKTTVSTKIIQNEDGSTSRKIDRKIVTTRIKKEKDEKGKVKTIITSRAKSDPNSNTEIEEEVITKKVIEHATSPQEQEKTTTTVKTFNTDDTIIITKTIDHPATKTQNGKTLTTTKIISADGKTLQNESIDKKAEE